MKKPIIFISVLVLFFLSGCQNVTSSKNASSDLNKIQKANSTSSLNLNIVDQAGTPVTTTSNVKDTTVEVDGLKIEGMVDLNSINKATSTATAKVK